jgi:hypothetical protein
MPNTQQSPPGPTGPAGPTNPLALLQQHHAKITMMDQIINELVSKQDYSLNNVTSINDSNDNIHSLQPQLNIAELSDLIMSKVEEQFDLKAFYENDEKLMNELEELKKIVQSQQLLINGLNTTLYSLYDKIEVITKNSFNQQLVDEQSTANVKAKQLADEQAKAKQLADEQAKAKAKLLAVEQAKAKQLADEQAKAKATQLAVEQANKLVNENITMTVEEKK